MDQFVSNFEVNNRASHRTSQPIFIAQGALEACTVNNLGSCQNKQLITFGAKRLEARMVFLAAEPDITPITNLITTWIHIGQALVGSIGALAFIFAFIWKITAVESHSALAAKQWIQRIVVGTIGVEVAGALVSILTSSVPSAGR
jgi:hypothetical protein